MSSGTVIVFSIVIVVGAVFFVINLIRSFYNSIFSDEGYLTLSFPKTTDSLLISKIIANFVWVISFVISFIIGLTIFVINKAENSVYEFSALVVILLSYFRCINKVNILSSALNS